jgi:hypothetical protein
MRSLRTIFAFAGAVAVVGLSSAVAEAGSTIDLRFTDYTGGAVRTSGGWGGGGAFLAESDKRGPMVTFCIEFPQPIYLNTDYTYSVEDAADAPQASGSSWDAMGSVKSDRLSRWFGTHYHALGGDDYNAWQAEEALAFQIGIWEIVAENDVNLDPYVGDFAISRLMNLGNRGGRVVGKGHNSLALASAWLSDSAWQQNDGMHLTAFSHDSFQDQVAAAPTPSAAIASMILLGGLAMKRRRAAS